jgi:hypothetical protein
MGQKREVLGPQRTIQSILYTQAGDIVSRRATLGDQDGDGIARQYAQDQEHKRGYSQEHRESTHQPLDDILAHVGIAFIGMATPGPVQESERRPSGQASSSVSATLNPA